MASSSQSSPFSALPNALITEIFASIDLHERHRTLALVCRQWSELVNSPQLLSCPLAVRLRRGWMEPRMQALCGWLQQRAGPHMRSLNLELEGFPGSEDQPPAQGLEGLASSLAACCGGGTSGGGYASPWQGRGLEHLCIHLQVSARPLHLSSPTWLPALASLHTLELCAVRGRQALSIGVSLAPLTALRVLRLNGTDVMLYPDASLPPLLTRLELGGRTTSPGGLPQQLAALSGLQALSLACEGRPAAEYGLLLQLPSLRSLEMRLCTHLPACLPHLARLESLVLDSSPGGNEIPAWAVHENQARLRTLGSAVAQLTRLTRLQVVSQFQLPSEGLAQVAACLARLQCLEWGPCPHPYVTHDATLPVGAWLNGLQRLSLPLGLAAGSLPALSAASRLEHLEAWQPNWTEECGADSCRAIVRWAPYHPALRRLVLVHPPAGAILEEALAAQRLNPGLCITTKMQAVDVGMLEGP